MLHLGFRSGLIFQLLMLSGFNSVFGLNGSVYSCKPDSSECKGSITVVYDISDNLWHLTANNVSSGDTLKVAGLLPHEGTPFMVGCCSETSGWYDSISGLNILIPEDISIDSLTSISFAADSLPLSGNPSVTAPGFSSGDSYRFSRSAEIRISGQQIFYSFGSRCRPGQWLAYTRPFLVNRTCYLWATNREQGKAASPPTRLQLIRINDFERLSTIPEAVGGSSPNHLLRLVDGYTALNPADSSAWVTWNSSEVEITLNPGVERTPDSLVIGFASSAQEGIDLPESVRFLGSADGQNWTIISEAKPGNSTQDKRVKVVLNMRKPLASFRYFKVTVHGQGEKTAIDEIGLRFKK